MIYIGADHGGFKLKDTIKSWLTGMELDYQDVGDFEYNPDDDYVDYAREVTVNVREDGDRGILICRSGVGMDIVANRSKHIRCGLGIGAEQVGVSRKDDDINVLAIASDYTDIDNIREMVKAFLMTEFSNEERYVSRLNKIKEL
jgi:ribose 5-phosphate isomerase B